MGQLRFNYFIGIRTPWTLTDESFHWEKGLEYAIVSQISIS